MFQPSRSAAVHIGSKVVLMPLVHCGHALPTTVKAAKQYSKRERDMLIRNSELSFHVRRLEEAIGTLEEQNKDFVSGTRVSLHTSNKSAFSCVANIK